MEMYTDGAQDLENFSDLQISSKTFNPLLCYTHGYFPLLFSLLWSNGANANLSYNLYVFTKCPLMI